MEPILVRGRETGYHSTAEISIEDVKLELVNVKARQTVTEGLEGRVKATDY